MQKTEPKTIEEYIKLFPAETQIILQQVRQAIHQAVPQAQEVISYKMPAFKQNSVLVYFAAYKNHIGFYLTGSGIEAFKNEFGDYKWSKGAVQFPIDAPMPLDLIKRISAFRAEKDLDTGRQNRIKII